MAYSKTDPKSDAGAGGHMSERPPADWPRHFPWPPTSAGLIIPASDETNRESGIAWYEVRLFPEANTVHLIAFDDAANDVAKNTIKIHGQNAAEFTISEGDVNITGVVTVGRTAAGETDVRTRITSAQCGGSGAMTGSSDGNPCLAAAELRALDRWGRLAEPLVTIARASQSALDTWGCASCLVLLAGVSVGAGCCATLNPGCCAATGIGGAGFIENCEGACA